MTKQEYEAKVLSLKGTHDYNMLCFIRGEYIASLEAEVAQLQADNRSLVEQMNQMARTGRINTDKKEDTNE